MTREPQTKAEWFDSLLAKRADRYTDEEQAAYRADLEARYAGMTDEAFAKAQAARKAFDDRSIRWNRGRIVR